MVKRYLVGARMIVIAFLLGCDEAEVAFDQVCMPEGTLSDPARLLTDDELIQRAIERDVERQGAPRRESCCDIVRIETAEGNGDEPNNKGDRIRRLAREARLHDFVYVRVWSRDNLGAEDLQFYAFDKCGNSIQ